jgi:hypothetical protein
VNRYQVFLNNEHVGDLGRFPERPAWHALCVVYDTDVHRRNFNKEGWWLMDKTPLHIDSVPKETRAMALLLGIA